jgi:5-amino-6-(5-phospho-D-ribitylamino)uracil phosphatase
LKALYVTDLDGTFLNSEKKVSKFSADVINRFIAQGGLFTIATARMPYGCDEKLSPINFSVPGILMNGACLYSFNEKKYVDVQSINSEKIAQIEEILNSQDCKTFMYAYANNALSIFYKTDSDALEASHISKRARQECSEIQQVDNYTAIASGRQIILFCARGSQEQIEALWEKVQAVKGIDGAIYTDIYARVHCIDIFDENANKANAIIRLKHLLQVDEITAFGDNQNDISMMQMADHCYAPENAIDAVKKLVDGIIESCEEDGVARFIQRKYRL